MGEDTGKDIKHKVFIKAISKYFNLSNNYGIVIILMKIIIF